MKKPSFEGKVGLVLTTGAFFLIIGLLGGLILASHLTINNKLSMDGLLQSLATLVGILAATYILPLKIQPLLSKQNGIVNVTQEDMRALLELIVDVLSICERFYLEGNKLSASDRKLILSRHYQIHSLAGILKTQSQSLPALSTFDDDIFQPLNDSHNDFADSVMPNKKLTEAQYLRIREQLNPVLTKIRELRYKLN